MGGYGTTKIIALTSDFLSLVFSSLSFDTLKVHDCDFILFGTDACRA